MRKELSDQKNDSPEPSNGHRRTAQMSTECSTQTVGRLPGTETRLVPVTGGLQGRSQVGHQGSHSHTLFPMQSPHPHKAELSLPGVHRGRMRPTGHTISPGPRMISREARTTVKSKCTSPLSGIPSAATSPVALQRDCALLHTSPAPRLPACVQLCTSEAIRGWT